MEDGSRPKAHRQHKIAASDLVRLLERLPEDETADDLDAVRRMVTAAERKLVYGIAAAC